MADWGWDLLRSFLGAGAGTAAVTGAIAMWRDRGKKRAESTYLAVRLAVILEAFSAACTDLIIFNASKTRKYNELSLRENLPQIGDYPQDGDAWRSFDANLASQCLNFRNHVIITQLHINSLILNSDQDLITKIDRLACARGLEAWQLAVEIRKIHRLEPVSPGYDYANSLIERSAKISEMDSKRNISKNT